MKSFTRFLTEARSSKASAQAKRLGLTGDGHGGWYDNNKEFVAKTEGDKLKFYNKNQIIGKQDPPQDRTPANQAVAATQVNPPTTATRPQQPPAQVEPEVEDKGILTVAFGRFNPPTIGHEKLLNKVSEVAEKGDFKIYPSRSNDPKKNPLDPDTKISIMRRMYPNFGEKIVNDPKYVSIIDVLKQAHEDGYSGINIVCGADRKVEYEKVATKYNGDLYDFAEILVTDAGDRDADADGVEGMSASKMRKAALDGDYKTFKTGIPKTIDDKESRKLFMTIRKSMNIEENYDLWEIAPKLDQDNLRENYIQNKIFQVGQFVENLNTGLIGKIIRRGANYLICVTEDNLMFKPWIKDVKEWTDNSGVPANQREVGTDAYREYAMKMTGTKKITNFNIKNFINKYKKK
jgi:hypothetical protein